MKAGDPLFQHVLDTYESETAKTRSVWLRFTDADLDWRPDPKSQTVREIFEHQLLSERRFFGEFLESVEPAPVDVLPKDKNTAGYTARLHELCSLRMPFLASRQGEWWLQPAKFFDVDRERIWIFWRRVLHTAHHRTQLTQYLRQLGKPVPAIYGPSADETFAGADPTNTVEAAGRR